MKKIILTLCLLPLLHSLVSADQASVLMQLKLLNQVPEEDLNDKTDPGFSILRTLYDQDGPDFLTLRTLLGKADVRANLNPSARCVLANVISQRWDTFSLSGNLYLTALRSKNPDLREKARKKLVCFIQPAHVPELINLLKITGPNVLAYEILQEVTGQHMDPTVKNWQKWWRTKGVRMDVVGHLLNETRNQVKQYTIHPFDEDRFWYLPEGLDDAQTPFIRRSESEKEKISEWNNWVGNDVKRYGDEWTAVKVVFDRIVHQPDPRVSKYLEKLVTDPGYGDYASVVLAWRSSRPSLPVIVTAVRARPTVGRVLARGSLGDPGALTDLLLMLEQHETQPLSYNIMDDDARNLLPTLRTVGAVPAEQAFELLCHRNFDFNSAYTPRVKKKVFKAAKTWLKENIDHLKFDPRRGYFTTPSEK